MNKYIKAADKLKSLNIEHSIWNQSLDLSFAHISMAAPSEVVYIVGPSRVGKSRLSSKLREMLNPPGVAINDPDSLSIGVRATNCSTNGTFSTKAFTRKILTELNHPIYGVSKYEIDKDVIKLGRRGTESELRLALERGLSATGKKFLFIDEAQNLMRAKGKEGPEAILDSWKCLAEDTGIILILTGTYPLHTIIQSAGHVIGRRGIVHFPRYHVNKHDIIGFKNILKAYSRCMPLDSTVGALEKHCQLFYNGSHGCIGLLERWLRNALSYSMAKNTDVSMDILDKSRLCNSDLRILYVEILEGEILLANDNAADPGSEIYLGGGYSQRSNKNNQNKKRVRRNSNPFTCNPARRKAGERVPGVIYV